GRSTRRISRNPFGMSPTFRITNPAVATSNVPSAKGSDSTLAIRRSYRAPTPAFAARRAATSSMPGEMSTPVTVAELGARASSASAKSPVPVPTSSARPVFPRGDLADAASINTGPLGAFGQALILVTVLVIIQLVTAFLPARGIRIAAGILTTVAGVLALAVVALATKPAESSVDPLALVAMPLGAIALGGADGAMLLGHWYLVTPKLSPGPLRRASLTVVAAIALQIALVGIVWLRGDLTGTWE